MKSETKIRPESLVKIEDHLGLVRAVVNKYEKGRRAEDSDLYSVGCLALVEAARSFDPSRANFSTWATRLIRQRVYREFRRFGIGQSEESEEQACHRSGPEDERRLERVCSLVGDSPADSKDYAAQKRIVRDHYILEKSLSEIGGPIGISKEAVRKRLRVAIAAIKKKNRHFLEEML